jgi:hypothetical protein
MYIHVFQVTAMISPSLLKLSISRTENDFHFVPEHIPFILIVPS